MPAGDYRCRTIKMGGGVPLTVYGFFACEVDEAADGYQAILKTSGSQRFSGTLTPSAGGLFYLGALNYADEDPIAYGVNAERDQVGCLYRSGDSYVLELPSPQFESVHDVIELVAAE